jgi:Na+-driven multidrug efflux pump
MHPLIADFEPGTLTALYIFAIGGLAIAVALTASSFLTRKQDRKAAKFYLMTAAVCSGASLLLILIALAFGKDLYSR